MEYITRSQWGAAPRTGIDSDFSKTGGAIIHHTAVDWPKSHADCSARWRSHQRYHQVNKQWTDIAYNWLVCGHGFIYEGRGWNAQNGANYPLNAETYSICWEGTVGSKVDGAVLSAINRILAEGKARGWATTVRGHKQVRPAPTQCPGELMKFIENGTLSPVHPPPPVVGPIQGTAVMGPAVATIEQATKWAVDNARQRGSSYGEDVVTSIVAVYYHVGLEYGVRADLALAQSAKETGFWTYGGDVKPTQWNFAGIGATGGVPGISFPNIEAGVRAHMLRMRMYAVNDPGAYNEAVLVRPLPQSHWGKYPTIEKFDGVWAVPGIGYGASVVTRYLNPMIATTVPTVPTVPSGPLTEAELAKVRTMISWWESQT